MMLPIGNIMPGECEYTHHEYTYHEYTHGVHTHDEYTHGIHTWVYSSAAVTVTEELTARRLKAERSVREARHKVIPSAEETQIT